MRRADPSATWETLDGRVLRLREMTDEHIENLFGYLERYLIELAKPRAERAGPARHAGRRTERALGRVQAGVVAEIAWRREDPVTRSVPERSATPAETPGHDDEVPGRA